MSRLGSEEKVKAYWLTTAPANLSAPTVAEITAGTNMSPFLPPDGGLDLQFTTNKVDTSNIETRWQTGVAGTVDLATTLTLFRDDENDDAWDLVEWGLDGVLVVSRFGTPAATDPVECYQIQLGQPSPAAPARDTAQQFTVGAFLTGPAVMDAVVA
jgi:hypothetical protein